jgi:hypothetical protein
MQVPENDDTQEGVSETKTVTGPTTAARPHRTADKGPLPSSPRKSKDELPIV